MSRLQGGERHGGLTIDLLSCETTAMSNPSDLLAARLRAGDERFTAAQLTDVESRLGHSYPPSFRRLLVEHGCFTLVSPPHGDTSFTVWPLHEHQTALARAAEELECEATAAEVAEQLGLNETDVAVLEQIILVGSTGNTDFIGFDLRTVGDDGEACFVLQLMDDSEIEYLAANPGDGCEPGFEAWVVDHAQHCS